MRKQQEVPPLTTSIKTFGELTAEQQAQAGGKGGSLAKMYQAGFPVPDGFVILPTAFTGDALTATAWSEIQAQLAQRHASPHDGAFAVRSSALSEDSAQASFAGEFESVLNVHTTDEIRRAIDTVYHSRHNERVQAYSQIKGLTEAHEIAVVVQQLVCAESSGVMFTANPVTGQRDQIVINAAWGLGEAIVSGRVSPDTLTVDKATGRVLKRETADKQVMTVLVEHRTEERSVPEKQRHAPVLSDKEAAELAQWGARIEQFYGRPMDIEWVMTSPPTSLLQEGGRIAIVQARPITALPEPEPPLPTKWKLPKGSYAALRNNIVELMIEPLTPLFDTLGRSCINASLDRLLTQFMGRSGVMPHEFIVSVNGFAYNNGSLSARGMGYVLFHCVGIMKRMFSGATERWQVARPLYVAIVDRWQATPWREQSGVEILRGVRELMEATIDAYGALVGGLIPGAWISEALFTFIYKLVRRRDDPLAPTYLLGYNSLPIQGEKALYDLAEWARSQNTLAAYLTHTPAAQLAKQLNHEDVPADVDESMWREWQSRFTAYLQRYGHAIYNLDFANPVPADDPLPVLETCQMFIAGQGANPHTRQQAAADRRERATQAMLARLTGWRLKLFRKYVASAQHYAPLREDGLADVGLSYPLLRQMLRELGRRFAAAGVIEQSDDVFWLTQREVEQAAAQLDRDEQADRLSDLIPPRKAAWRAALRSTPPLMLPHMKLIEKMKTARKRRGGKGSLKGVAASPGRVTATARVLNGPQDFDQMQTGDVLVASITTPAWTPLFARAAAVVTDVGGPLSHGSIVAREYGIPAVLGTGVATNRIHSGQVITVDGSAGVVTLSRNGDR